MVKLWDYSNVQQLVHRTANGSEVAGVTCLGDEVFILRHDKEEVDVFNVNTLSQQRQILVNGLRRPRDTASCAQNNCLYICENGGRRVYRVELSGSPTNWTVNGCP